MGKNSTWCWSKEHTTWRAFPREESVAYRNEETVAFPEEETSLPKGGGCRHYKAGITAICTTILTLMATSEVQRPEAVEIYNTLNAREKKVEMNMEWLSCDHQ